MCSISAFGRKSPLSHLTGYDYIAQAFSGVMHMADYAEHVINSRIWTQTQQIEQQLANLNEHMEKVIQMYLRSDYATIADYNRQAGTIAEKYHFVVVADFPNAFSETANTVSAISLACHILISSHRTCLIP